MIRLYNEDCLAAMREMDNDNFDLAITSPPYDNLRTYNNSLDWNEVIWKAIIKELYRVLKPGGVVVWIVNDATINGTETGTSFRQALWAIDCGFYLHDTMIYQKDNPTPTGGSNRYFQEFEYMFILSKNSPKTFNPLTRIRRNKYGDKRTERYRAVNRDKNGEFKKKIVKIKEHVKIGNIWKYIVGGGNSVEYGINHPAAFPEQLVLDHINTWSNKGDLVLDPFMGSGTTGKVCIDTGRSFIGIEKEISYFQATKKRLEEHQKQLRLF